MNLDRDTTSLRPSGYSGGNVDYNKKLNAAYEELKEKLGTLSAYTIFRLAVGKVPSDVSGKIVLTEREVLADLNESEFSTFWSAVKSVLISSFGESVAELLLEDLWK